MKGEIRVFKNCKGEIVTDSLQVAKDLNKRHIDVMLDIYALIYGLKRRGLTIEGVCEHVRTPQETIYPKEWFKEVEYSNEQNKQKYKKFELTKNGFMAVIMQYQGHDDIKVQYINDYDAMEKYILETKQRNQFMDWRTKEAHDTHSFHLNIDNDKKCIGLCIALKNIVAYKYNLDFIYDKESLYQMYFYTQTKDPYKFYVDLRTTAEEYVRVFSLADKEHYMSNVIKALTNKYIEENEIETYEKYRKTHKNGEYNPPSMRGVWGRPSFPLI